jgi:hypothetical protein
MAQAVNKDLKIIVEFVASRYKISPELLNLNTRKREIIRPRQIAHWLSKKVTKFSLQEIGSHIGGKDHATVLHSMKTINNLIDTERDFASEINQLIADYQINIAPLLNRKYNYEVLSQERSNRRFEIQRDHYERLIAKLANNSLLLLHQSEKVLHESHIIEGWLKAKHLNRIKAARRNFRELKLNQ